MKKLRICSNSIPVELFDREIIILITNSKDFLYDKIEEVLSEDLGMIDKYAKEFAEELREVLKEEQYLSPGLTVSVTTESGYSNTFCIFEGNSPKDITKEVIIHEMYHAMSAICRKAGVEDEETSAYLIEYLCHKFFEIATNFGKKG